VIFLVSDFLTDEDLFGSSELKMLGARHDLIAVVIEDPAETRLPSGSGVVELKDLESGRRRRVALSRTLQEQYAAHGRRRREQLTRSFYQVPMDHVFVRSDQWPIEPLLDLFAARKRA
jgi:hypothetical protein